MSTTLLAQTSDPLMLVGKLGQSFGESAMFGCKTVPQGHVLALHCIMENVSPLTILQTYHFIEGKLSMRADAMLGRASTIGKCKYEVKARNDQLATIEMENEHGKKCEFSLSWEDCQKEPFVWDKNKQVKTNYATPRSRTQMLWARVVSEAVRTICPQVVCGAYTPEEISDMDESPAGRVIETTATETTAPEKKTRKRADAASAATTDASVNGAGSNESISTSTATAETTGSAGTEGKVAETVSTATATEATSATETASFTAPKLPQIVIDIVALRDYVGSRWPADSKHGPWDKLWELVKSRLNISPGETDEERFTKASEPQREKALGWLNTQREIVDKLSTAKDLASWANKNPTTSAAKA